MSIASQDFLIEQRDVDGDWFVLGSAASSPSAVNMMHGYRLLYQYSALRVVEIRYDELTMTATREIVVELPPLRRVA